MLATELVLYVPGMLDLFGLFNELPARERPSLGTLERFLARARQATFVATEPEQGLLELFGISGSAEKSLPVAPFTHLVDSGKTDSSVVMRADPVFLQADRHRLVLLAHAELGLTARQAGQLAQDITTHFKDDGWRLHAVQPERWYIELTQATALLTTPPSAVLEHDVNAFLPQGEDGGYWRGVMNEIQMLLHDHPVNIERESHAQAPVNSLWLWGNGQLPAATSAHWQTAYGEDVLLKGLARWAGVAEQVMPDSAEALLASLHAGRGLLHFGGVWRKWCELDVYGGQEWWTGFQTNWFEPLLMAVRAGHIDKLELVAGHGVRFSLCRADGRRWWKRSYPALYRTNARSGGND